MTALSTFISLIHICDVMMALYKKYTGDGCSVQFHQFNPYFDVMMTLYKTYTGDGCFVQFHQFNPY